MASIPDRAAFEQQLTERWREGGNTLISIAMRQYDQISSMLKLMPEEDKQKVLLGYTTHVGELISALTVEVAPIIEQQLQAARSKIK